MDQCTRGPRPRLKSSAPAEWRAKVRVTHFKWYILIFGTKIYIRWQSKDWAGYKRWLPPVVCWLMNRSIMIAPSHHDLCPATNMRYYTSWTNSTLASDSDYFATHTCDNRRGGETKFSKYVLTSPGRELAFDGNQFAERTERMNPTNPNSGNWPWGFFEWCWFLESSPQK